ncbi:hypothetical protein NPIL_217361 [Nephila pilipes]|uniref:Uncharacterized protein n=1 Tax=Nephila pilipes TaxID=299642 RepID=A0A8X6PA72_NEPPI|nr:hypothetical protein NPIL_217361 [Nephila pilipes]
MLGKLDFKPELLVRGDLEDLESRYKVSLMPLSMSAEMANSRTWNDADTVKLIEVSDTEEENVFKKENHTRDEIESDNSDNAVV